MTSRVVIVNHRPSHLLHFVLAVITCGLWIPIWILITARANVAGMDTATLFARVAIFAIFLGLFLAFRA